MEKTKGGVKMNSKKDKSRAFKKPIKVIDWVIKYTTEDGKEHYLDKKECLYSSASEYITTWLSIEPYEKESKKSINKFLNKMEIQK
jgi:hypothetical protein